MNPVLESARIAQQRRDERRAAAITAVLFAAVLLAGAFITFFEVPDPPLGTQFVSVGLADFGFDPAAGGMDESENPSASVQDDVSPNDATSTSAASSTAASGAVTQSESDLAVNPSANPNASASTGSQRQVSDRLASRMGALAQQGGGGSDGRSTGTGNEGNPLGKIDGMGIVEGDGFQAGLGGGTLVGKPRLAEKPTRSGTIQIDITVDAQGKVIETRFVLDRSTISDSRHIDLAKKAARTATFTAAPGTPRRYGFINIRFELE
jgi:hypothetical protein